MRNPGGQSSTCVTIGLRHVSPSFTNPGGQLALRKVNPSFTQPGPGGLVSRNVNPSFTQPGPGGLVFRHVRPSSTSPGLHSSKHVSPSFLNPGGQSARILPPTSLYFFLNAFSPLHPHPQSRRFFSSFTHLANVFSLRQLYLPPPQPQSSFDLGGICLM